MRARREAAGGPVNCGLTNENPAIIERALKSAIACSCVSSHGCDRDWNRMSLWNLKFREWFVALSGLANWRVIMSVGTIILIILVIALLGGFSGIGGGPFYGTGYYGGGGLES